MKSPKNYQEYLYEKKKKKYQVILIQLFILIMFFASWEFLVNINFLNEFLVSKPSKIFALFLSYLQSNSLMTHIYVSVLETIIGLVIGSVLGLIIAILLYFSKTLYKILDPYLTILNALPKTALAPILIIWAGTNMKGIILVSVSLSLIITIISSYSYFQLTDENLIKLMRVLNANKRQILFKVILPSNLANILAILKINVGLSWIGTIVGEFLVSKNGIGYLLMYGGMVFRLDLVMMGVIILAVIAFLMYEVISIFEKSVRDKKRTHKTKKKLS